MPIDPRYILGGFSGVGGGGSLQGLHGIFLRKSLTCSFWVSGDVSHAQSLLSILRLCISLLGSISDRLNK